MINRKTKAVFFLSEIDNKKFALVVFFLVFSSAAFSFSPSLRFKKFHLRYDTTGCDHKDTLNWKDIPEGVKDSTAEYSKEGLSTKISSRHKPGASASLKVGKGFKNKSSLEWHTTGARNGITSAISFVFNASPDNFSISLQDIDREADDVVDSLIISAYRNGDLISLSQENIISIGTAVNFSGDNSFTGILDAEDASGDGDISINYFVPIDSIVFTINNASTVAKVSSRQQLGVGNFSWCAAGRNPVPEVETPSISVSEGLSPNGDDILDAWIIEGIERYPNNNVKIFNVWGDLVFEQEHYHNESNAWRGECNQGAAADQRIPDGTYYYVLNPGDGSKVLKGFVMLKR